MKCRNILWIGVIFICDIKDLSRLVLIKYAINRNTMEPTIRCIILIPYF
jgi:hypothetical protein